MTTPATAIVAAHLGLGDVLPSELGAMVDTAFFANYETNRGRHGVLVPLHYNGAEVVQGETLEGDDVQVAVTYSTETRTATATELLADVWRFAVDGARIEDVEVRDEDRTTAVFAIAETWDAARGALWMITLWDQRGIPVALLDPDTFDLLVRHGRASKHRIGQMTRHVGGNNNSRALAASSAVEYLNEQQANLTDDGQRPVWWMLSEWTRQSGAVVRGGNGPFAGNGLSRRKNRQLTAADATISQDASLRTDPWAESSSLRRQPLPARRDQLNWRDPTGDEAAALADGGPVVHLMDRGLTERQALMWTYKNAGFKHAEIAKAFGCTVSTVKNTVAKARKKRDRAI